MIGTTSKIRQLIHSPHELSQRTTMTAVHKKERRMKSVKYTFILLLLIGLSIPAVSGEPEKPAQDAQLAEWTVPDCRNVTGTHCFTYTTDEGLSFAHQL